MEPWGRISAAESGAGGAKSRANPGSGRGAAEGGGLDSGGAKEDNERVKRGGEDEGEEGGALMRIAEIAPSLSQRKGKSHSWNNKKEAYLWRWWWWGIGREPNPAAAAPAHPDRARAPAR